MAILAISKSYGLSVWAWMRKLSKPFSAGGSNLPERTVYRSLFRSTLRCDYGCGESGDSLYSARLLAVVLVTPNFLSRSFACMASLERG